VPRVPVIAPSGHYQGARGSRGNSTALPGDAGTFQGAGASNAYLPNSTTGVPSFDTRSFASSTHSSPQWNTHVASRSSMRMQPWLAGRPGSA